VLKLGSARNYVFVRLVVVSLENGCILNSLVVGQDRRQQPAPTIKTLKLLALAAKMPELLTLTAETPKLLTPTVETPAEELTQKAFSVKIRGWFR